MSDATDFEVVTWALDNGWFREGGEWRYLCTGEFEGNYSTAPDGLMLMRMRSAFAEARKPPLAERIATAVARELGDQLDFPTPALDPSDPSDMKIIAAAQAVLDEEGVK